MTFWRTRCVTDHFCVFCKVTNVFIAAIDTIRGVYENRRRHNWNSKMHKTWQIDYLKVKWPSVVCRGSWFTAKQHDVAVNNQFKRLTCKKAYFVLFLRIGIKLGYIFDWSRVRVQFRGQCACVEDLPFSLDLEHHCRSIHIIFCHVVINFNATCWYGLTLLKMPHSFLRHGHISSHTSKCDKMF